MAKAARSADREEARRTKREAKRAKREARRKGGLTPRPQNVRQGRQRFLIVCEGACTEPNYFEAYRDLVQAEIKVIGAGMNTTGLVRFAVSSRDQLIDQGSTFDQHWVVFDRDSFLPDRFNEAIRQAEAEGFQVAWTNEAFELWYLLHFHYCDAALHRSTYAERLRTALERPYQKNAEDMFERLHPKQPTAIRNAQTLLSSYGAAHSPERDNPSTAVHQLVCQLNQSSRGASWVDETCPCGLSRERCLRQSP